MYISRTTENGNSSYSYVSQEGAEDNVYVLDENGCRNCVNCIGCNNCIDCTNCVDCVDCRNCINCTECEGCEDCNGLTEELK